MTFLAGIAWFFAHQLIGVGNDVITKFVGGNFAVAQAGLRPSMPWSNVDRFTLCVLSYPT